MWAMAASVTWPSCSCARCNNGINADFGRGNRPMISLATSTLASFRRATIILSRGLSPVDLTEDGIHGGDGRDCVGDEPTAQHVRETLHVDEARSADVHPIRRRRPVRDDVAPDLAPGALDGDVHLALRHLEPFGE